MPNIDYSVLRGKLSKDSITGIEPVESAADTKSNNTMAICKRMKAMKSRLRSTAAKNDPNNRINKSLRKYKCGSEKIDWAAIGKKLAEDKEASQELEVSDQSIDPPVMHEAAKPEQTALEVKLAAAESISAMILEDIQNSLRS